MRKSMFVAVTGLVLVLGMISQVPAQDREERRGRRAGRQEEFLYARMAEVEGKVFFTTANIFYEKPERIYSTNYLKGKILPAGSKVTITYAGGREIEFRDEKGVKFMLILKRKHASETTTLKKYFDQYFSTENPMRPDGPFPAFSETEQWNIKNGMIEKGMSRAAVLMSYGYPPAHETPDLSSDKWAYWVGSLRGSPLYVYFKNDRVYRIISEGKMSWD